MAAIEGIMIVVVAVAVIAGIYSIMVSNYEVIDTFNSITQNQRESVQEDVELNIDKNGQIYIKNKSPTPVKIVEMRVLNDDGTVRTACTMDETFSGGEKLDIASFIPSTSTIINATSTEISGCTSQFDGN